METIVRRILQCPILLPLFLWYLRVTERVKKSRNKSGCYFYEAMRSRSCGLELRVRESSSHFSICISSPYVVLSHRGAVVTELITVRQAQSITCIPDTQGYPGKSDANGIKLGTRVIADIAD